MDRRHVVARFEAERQVLALVGLREARVERKRANGRVRDLHATMLHLLGLDHKRLTFRFGGRDMRLTDVHGELVQGILG